MSETVKLIISLSISGSILAGIILAIKPFIRHKFSKSLQYYIWLVVLLRLVIPFSFEESLMNWMFYRESAPIKVSGHEEIKTIIPSGDAGYTLSNIRETAEEVNGGQQIAVKKTIDLKALFLNNLFYIWLAGALMVLTANLAGYMKFSVYLNRTSTPAGEEESMMLKSLLNGKYRATLVRNRFAATPMLMGVIRPQIIIPDVDFTDSQLRNILLHELIHLRRFDIGVKWLAVAAASIHWFNPIVYFIKKEVNHACELSCDEAVIKNLNDEDRQEYGDTLISVVAEQKYPIGILSATMCEEKKTLKERLISIMQHSKKSRFITLVSAVLLLGVMGTSVVLGAGVGFTNKRPPDICIGTEFGKIKTAVTGSYHWKYGTSYIIADADHPNNFEYKAENIVSVGAGEQMIISTQKIKADKRYDFTLEGIEVYKNRQFIRFESVSPSFLNHALYLQAPKEAGEYIYSLRLKFGDRGTVNYGFVVRVDMATYDLTEIEKFKTPYIGNHSKVMSIVGQLPVPDRRFKQQYISMKTSSEPYKLTVYYEGISDMEPGSGWTIDETDKGIHESMQKNALVLFCMVDNLDEVIFAYRTSPTIGDLDTSQYVQSASYTREGIEKLYGNIEAFSKDMELLSRVLDGRASASNNEIEHLISVIMSSPSLSSNTGDYIAAHKTEYDTIVNMAEEALPYLVEILNSGDRGLRGNIVSIICSDILKKIDENRYGSDNPELVAKTLDAIDKWSNMMGYTIPLAPPELLPEFTEEEVTKARAVVQEYFRAIAAKDDKAILATLHESRKSDNMILYGSEKRTLIKVEYNPQDSMRKNYRRNDDKFAPNKIIVFKVSFNIEYPKGEGGPWNNGVYDNWSMILIRENENSPWFIYDQGY